MEEEKERAEEGGTRRTKKRACRAHGAASVEEGARRNRAKRIITRGIKYLFYFAVPWR